MRAVTVVTHECPVGALRMVVLVARESVVDQHDDPALKARRSRAHERARDALDLGAVGLRGKTFRVDARRLRGRAGRPRERPVAQRNTQLDDAVFASLEPVHGHRVEHLVADDGAAEARRQAVEPRDPLDEVRGARRESVAAAVAKVGAELQDEVARRCARCALELQQHVGGKRAAPRADLQDLGQPEGRELS